MEELETFQMQEKRHRSYNWSAHEKELLHNFAIKYSDIIDCKDNSTPMIDKKHEIWKMIQNQMASMGYFHEARRLKQQWVRIKQTNKNLAYKSVYENNCGEIPGAGASSSMPSGVGGPPHNQYPTVEIPQAYYSTMIPEIQIKEEKTDNHIPNNNYPREIESEDISNCSSYIATDDIRVPVPIQTPEQPANSRQEPNDTSIPEILSNRRRKLREKRLWYDTELQKARVDLEKAKIKVEEKKLELLEIQIKYFKSKSFTNGC